MYLKMKRILRIRLFVSILALTLTISSCSLFTHENQSPDYSVHPQVVAVIGDFGSGLKPEFDVAQMVKAQQPSFVLTVGDNAYKHDGYKKLVREYYSQPLVAATGNHDYLLGIGNFDNFFGVDSQTRNYVYHAASGADFFILDSTAGLESKTIRSQQESWLTQQLAISNANFKIVVLHHPPYSSSKHGSTKVYQWPYAEMGADLVISGHDHSYERIERWSGIYIVDGTGGAKLYKCKPKLVYGSQGCDDKHYGALFLYINGYQLRGIFRDTNGRALDTFDVVK